MVSSLQPSQFAFIIVATALHGISFLQMFLYALHHRRSDRIPVQLMVACIFLVGTAQFAYTIRGAWVLLQIEQTDILVVSKEYLIGGEFSAVSAFVTQIYFTWRISRLWERQWRPVLVLFVLGALAQLVGYTAFMSLVLASDLSLATLIKTSRLLEAIWAISVAEDTLIALAVLYPVWKTPLQDDTPIRDNTNRLLVRLTIVIINSGLWTAAFALAGIIAVTVQPSQTTYPSLYLLICPLYVNTFLANVNSRTFVRRGIDTTMDISTSGPGSHASRNIRSIAFRAGSLPSAVSTGQDLELDSVSNTENFAPHHKQKVEAGFAV